MMRSDWRGGMSNSKFPFHYLSLLFFLFFAYLGPGEGFFAMPLGSMIDLLTVLFHPFSCLCLSNTISVASLSLSLSLS